MESWTGRAAPVLRGVEAGQAVEGYLPLALKVERGSIAARFYRAPSARAAVLMVGGIGGGFDTPARGLYPRLGASLCQAGVSALRVRFRYSTRLAEAVYDVLAGVEYLRGEGVVRVGLVGHSFGGAVVIQAAAASPLARTVVTLASQSFGAEPVATLAPRCSILLAHGTSDAVLPPINTRLIHDLARGERRLLLYPAAGHGLDEVADALYDEVRGWLLRALADPRERTDPVVEGDPGPGTDPPVSAFS